MFTVILYTDKETLDIDHNLGVLRKNPVDIIVVNNNTQHLKYRTSRGIQYCHIQDVSVSESIDTALLKYCKGDDIILIGNDVRISEKFIKELSPQYNPCVVFNKSEFDVLDGGSCVVFNKSVFDGGSIKDFCRLKPPRVYNMNVINTSNKITKDGITFLIPSIQSPLIKSFNTLKGENDSVFVFNVGNRTIKYYLNKYIKGSINNKIVIINPESTILDSDMIDIIRKDNTNTIKVFDTTSGYTPKRLSNSLIISFDKSRYKELNSKVSTCLELQKYIISLNTNNIKYKKYGVDPLIVKNKQEDNRKRKAPIRQKSGSNKPSGVRINRMYSIIIPFMYNKDRFPLFEATVKCLFELTKDNNNIEIVVHETAPKRKLSDEFLIKYGIKYMFSEWNEVFHRAWALNAGVKHVSSGSVYVFMDADVLVSDGWVDELLNFNSGVSIGWGKIHNLTPQSTSQYIKTNVLTPQSSKTRVPSTMGAAGGITVMDHVLFDDIGGWPEDFRGTYGGEDNAMMLKIEKLHGKPSIFKSNVYHLYHSHTTFQNPLRIAIIRDMKHWDRDQWKEHTNSYSDYGKRFWNSEVIVNHIKPSNFVEHIKPSNFVDYTGQHMKVLWLCRDRSKRVASHFDALRKSFSGLCEVDTIIHTPGNHSSFVRDQLNKKDYDFIICDSPLCFCNEDWSNISIPKAVIIEDQHNKSPKQQIQFAVDNDFIILHRYQFNKYHTNLSSKVKTIWFPHSVNTEVFKDFNLPKEYDLLQTGAMWDVYKTRILVNKTMTGEMCYTYIPRPNDKDANKWPIGIDYAKELNKSKFTVCCGSDHQYPVMKYFEIPASGSIIYGDYFNELGNLGFVPGVNMIQIDPKNIKSQIRDLSNNPFELKRLKDNGINLIQSRHTNEIRAKELVEIIKENT